MTVVNHMVIVIKIKKQNKTKHGESLKYLETANYDRRWWFSRLLQVIEPYFSIKLQFLLVYCWIFYLFIDVKDKLIEKGTDVFLATQMQVV